MKYILALILLCLTIFTDIHAQRSKRISVEDSTARVLQAPGNKAIVYILRPGRYINPQMQITCDGANIGSTVEQTYLFTIIDPGAHTFISTAENTSKLTITVEAGKIYYVEQQIKYGFAEARALLVLVDAEKGKKLLEKCRLSKDNQYKL